jgi:hypothetical protein
MFWRNTSPLSEPAQMPWTSNDAERHTHKATTMVLKELWAKVANECLERTGDEELVDNIKNYNGMSGVLAGSELDAKCRILTSPAWTTGACLAGWSAGLRH